jgi:hypothetical protein
MLPCILMTTVGHGPLLAPTPPACLLEDAAAGREPEPSSSAEREVGSRDWEGFTGGGAGLAVLIVLVAILVPWQS